MRQIFWLFSLLCCFTLFSHAEISVFWYEEEPNEGSQPIAGLELGNDWLASFQYTVEITGVGDASQFDVEVAFFNQWGQILNTSPIKHKPTNADEDDEIYVESPTLPMLEGRNQLLSWARVCENAAWEMTLNSGEHTMGLTAVNVTMECGAQDDAADASYTVTMTLPDGTAHEESCPSGVYMPLVGWIIVPQVLTYPLYEDTTIEVPEDEDVTFTGCAPGSYFSVTSETVTAPRVLSEIRYQCPVAGTVAQNVPGCFGAINVATEYTVTMGTTNLTCPTVVDNNPADCATDMTLQWRTWTGTLNLGDPITNNTANELLVSGCGDGQWQLGPYTFQEGNNAGGFIFIDTNQGPPDAPYIDNFACQGVDILQNNAASGNTCGWGPRFRNNPRTSLDAVDNRFRFDMVFNHYDYMDALSSGPRLTVTYSGYVLNNPSRFRSADGSLGLAGGKPKFESNAYVDSWLLATQYSSSVNPEDTHKVTGTGPYPISIRAGDPPIPQVIYPDENAYPYGAPYFNAYQDDWVNHNYDGHDDYPYGNTTTYTQWDSNDQGLGRYVSFHYDFTQMADGDYEIWVSSDDVVAVLTNQGQSPGALTASGGRTEGVTTVIRVVKDSVLPNSFSFSLVPDKRFLILGDQDEIPPFPYEKWQAELFLGRGAVSDERSEANTMYFQMKRDDGVYLDTTGGNAGAGGYYYYVQTAGDGSYSYYFDMTIQEPNTTASPPGEHFPATGGQRAYQLIAFPIDPQGNISITTQAVYIIKDLEPPSDPVILEPATGTEIVTSTFLNFFAESSNLDLGGAFDLREHGTVEMEISVVDAQGKASMITTAGAAINVTNDSRLDNHASWNHSNTVSGVDYFGNLAERFEFAYRFNLTEFADGQIDIVARIVDEVGNWSSPVSTSIIKDTTGPVITIEPRHRGLSGPDNNFPVPNQLGSDDDVYIISLISSELTTDLGSDGPEPLVSDPGSRDLLHLEGMSSDMINNTARITVFSDHTDTVSANIQTPTLLETDFDVDIDVTGLLEGVREVVGLQAFDQTDIPGPVYNVNVYRDVTPANVPQVTHPALQAWESIRKVYTSTDHLVVRGKVTGTDAEIKDTEDGQQRRSKAVILIPPADPTQFTTGEAVPRIPRSAPDAVPRMDSWHSSFPRTDTEADYYYLPVDDEGAFETTVFLGNVPENATVPTTIWVQIIDQFENTDPANAVPIEVYRVTYQTPVASLELRNFRETEGNHITVYPPEELPSNVVEQLYMPLERVFFRLYTFVPFLEAPQITLFQTGADGKLSSMLSSTPSPLGTNQFDYSYQVYEKPGLYDGTAKAVIEGGEDVFGNSILPMTITTMFILDSLAPNTTVSSEIVTEQPPEFIPASGSRIRTQSIIFSAHFEDLAPGNGSNQPSGIDTSTSQLQMVGPLHLTPDQTPLAAQAVIPPVTGYDLSFRVDAPLQDGVYRLGLKAMDQVRNSRWFYSNFVFDDTPVSGPLLITEPSDASFIRVFPTTSARPYVELEIQRLDADLNVSDFSLFSPAGVQIMSVQKDINHEDYKIRNYYQASDILYDGSMDGSFTIRIHAVDVAGNELDKDHVFVLDTKAPVPGVFYPAHQSCVTYPFSIADMAYSNLPGHENFAIPLSDISDQSTFEMSLLQAGSFRTKTLTGASIAGDVKLMSVHEAGETTGKLAFIPTHESYPRVFALDGTEDGLYEMKTKVVDAVGNSTNTTAVFGYDTLAPTINIADFSEDKVLGVTGAGFLFQMVGSIQDEGVCNFSVSEPYHNGYTTLTAQIYPLNEDTLERQPPLFDTPVAVEDLSFQNPADYPYQSSQAGFQLSTFVGLSFSGTQDYYLMEAELKVQDQVGNSSTVSRRFRLVNHLMSIPSLIEPPLFSVVDGLETTYITASPVVDIKWEAIQGIETVIVEIFREKESSVTPAQVLTSASWKQVLQSVSLTRSGTGIFQPDSKELFSIRISGLDTQGVATAWGPKRYLYLDSTAPEVTSIKINGFNGWLEAGSTSSLLTTNEVGLKFTFSEPVVTSSASLVQAEIQESGVKFSLASVWNSAKSTQEFYYSGLIPTVPEEAYPRLPLKLFLSGFKDVTGQVMQGVTTEIALDLGLEPAVRVFSNPVSPKELIAVIKFLSHLNQADDVAISPESSQPGFILKKGRDERVLQWTPFDASGAYARSFSVPLALTPADSGYFTLQMSYTDSLGRRALKNREISLGQYTSSRGLVLASKMSGIRLEVPAGSKDSDGSRVVLSGDFEEMSSREDGYLLLKDINVFDSSNALPGKLQFSSLSLSQASTHLVVVTRSEAGLQFVTRINEDVKQVQIQMDSDYFVASDEYDPEIIVEEEIVLSAGRNRLPLVLRDLGSGIDPAKLTVSLDETDLNYSFKDDGLWVTVPEHQRHKGLLQLSVSDLSGRNASLNQVVSVLSGEGIDWAYVVPNPVRGNEMILRYMSSGIAQRVELSIYDASSKRVAQMEGMADPGMNDFRWDLFSQRGSSVANGVYFFRLKAWYNDKKYVKTGKFAILR